jgi:BirA family biotin operon repressor/biotin-[acetyl-CoA-carboxylase] ligase
LNVNVDFALWPNLSPSDTPLVETATSLLMILGRPIARLGLLQQYLSLVEKRYEALRIGFNPHRDWAGRLITLGREVSIFDFEATRTGLAEAVDEDGALLVRLEDGRLERVLAGDVTLR